MGLDFSLYKKRKEQSWDEFFDEEHEELAYGRKSWELVRVLATGEDIDNCYGILTSESWENLMRLMDPIGDLLGDIADSYSREYAVEEDGSEFSFPELIFTKEDKELISKYEYWYYKSFNDYPMLGFDFSIGYMKSFYGAKEKVREVLKDPDYEVAMSISY